MLYLQLDYFVLSETKINDTFLSAHFNISGYEISTRRAKDRKKGVVIEYVKRELILKNRETFKQQYVNQYPSN